MAECSRLQTAISMLQRFFERVVPTALLVLAFAGGQFGPESARAQVKVSLQAGTTLSTVAGSLRFRPREAVLWEESEEEDEDVDFSYLAGLAVRATAAIPIRPGTVFQLGVAYTGKGMVYRYRTEGALADYHHVRTGYLEFPIILRYSWSAKRRFSPHAGVGPVFSFLATCTAVGKGDDFKIAIGCPTVTILNKSVDIGMTGNFGVTMATSRFWSASLDVLYQYGLRSTLKTSDLENRAFSIVAGITFPLRCNCD